MTTERKIIHIDMDAFYASVEQRDNPDLRGKPAAVGHAEKRGVVAAASYEARKFGVRSAMSSVKAMKLCPQLHFVEGRMDVYKEVSGQIHEIFHRYTDLIEPISLDEAFLDVTHNKKGIELAVDIAREIKQSIREELHLVASASPDIYRPLTHRIVLGSRTRYGTKDAHVRHLQRENTSGMLAGDAYPPVRKSRTNLL